MPFLLGRAAGPFGPIGKEKEAKIQLLYHTFSVFYMPRLRLDGHLQLGQPEGQEGLREPPKGSMRNSQALVQLTTGLKAGEDWGL